MAFEDVGKVSLLGANAEIIQYDISFFVLEFRAFGIQFLGFLNIGEDFCISFARRRITFLLSGTGLTLILFSDISTKYTSIPQYIMQVMPWYR